MLILPTAHLQKFGGNRQRALGVGLPLFPKRLFFRDPFVWDPNVLVLNCPGPICPRIAYHTKMGRAGGGAVDLGGHASVYQGGPKFEFKHKSRYFQKSKLVDWGGSMLIGGSGPQDPLGSGPDDGGIPLSAFPHGTSKLAGLFSTLFLLSRAGLRVSEA